MRSVCKEDEERKLKGGGYTISVVILEKMEVSEELRRKYRKGTSLSAIFADALKNRLNRGRCNDDALIVLAINDSSTVIMSWLSVRKLTEEPRISQFNPLVLFRIFGDAPRRNKSSLRTGTI
ncbi:unnamed protein product [Meloidogyne enterolobii]|uniref:Uncharacterized protein n=1 Tax=Meloidogyne enterolobii TaxID=390850 RepID=A0ACB1A5C9_MELEN